MILTKIALAADHRGFALKTELIRAMHADGEAPCGQLLAPFNITAFDCGTFSPERTDYPPYAKAVAHKIISGEVDAGILLCGTGAGMVMAANRVRGIRAAVVWNPLVAARVREEDACTIIVLPADYLDARQACACIAAWLEATPRGGRYAARVAMLDE